MNGRYVRLADGWRHLNPHNAQEGAKPGQAWPDEKIMGVTLGSESDIQLAVEKVKAVLSVINKTRSATGAKMAEPKSLV